MVLILECENTPPSTCYFLEPTPCSVVVTVSESACDQKWSELPSFGQYCQEAAGLVKDKCRMTCGNCNGNKHTHLQYICIVLTISLTFLLFFVSEQIFLHYSSEISFEKRRWILWFMLLPSSIYHGQLLRRIRMPP